MLPFSIDGLDHVALRVKDLDASVAWYQKYLGLRYYKLPEWGDFPVFLLAGKSGIALFPANTEDPVLDPRSKNRKIDHFAFHIGQDALAQARKHFEELGLGYDFRDHFYFHSIYTTDPDGHTVELTALIVPEESFYPLGKEA